jgi:hypothetical protein
LVGTQKNEIALKRTRPHQQATLTVYAQAPW